MATALAVTLPGYVPEAEAASLLGYRLRYLQQLRYQGVGPVYIKRGKAVCYKLSDLEDFLDAQRVDPEDLV